MKRAILLASILSGGLAYSASADKKEEAKPVPEPVIVKLDTGLEVLKITHDGKIYSGDKLLKDKVLTIKTKQKAFEKCARMLVSQMGE